VGDCAMLESCSTVDGFGHSACSRHEVRESHRRYLWDVVALRTSEPRCGLWQWIVSGFKLVLELLGCFLTYCVHLIRNWSPVIIASLVPELAFVHQLLLSLPFVLGVEKGFPFQLDAATAATKVKGLTSVPNAVCSTISARHVPVCRKSGYYF